jgi:hypothetical protein
MAFERDLENIRHKVRLTDISGDPSVDDPSFLEWFNDLPPILAGGDVKDILDRWIGARRSGKPVIWGFGAHLIKVGLSRWLIALMEEGLVTHLAVNGAVAIHDFELAAVGSTSEDVGSELSAGSFGQASRTGEFINRAAVMGLENGLGLGEALGQAILDARLPHGEISVLASAHRLGIPFSVHLALGTDTIHAHPEADGKALGDTSLRDFNRLTAWVGDLGGGAYFNIGSAVILPEVFLKAVSQAKAAGRNLSGMTTVVMDFIKHYRPYENVCRRPVEGDGRGFYLIGHHEIMIPLIARAALSRWRSGD